MTADSNRILLALGASRAGRWGAPDETLARCIEALPRAGFDVVAASSLYETAGVGPGPATSFVNAAVCGETHLAPGALLRVLKRMERDAGGRSAMRWGPRTLDIDILAYRDRIIASRLLTVPHPELQKRPFVLAPLLEIAPGWRHPVLGLTVRQLWRRLAPGAGGQVLRRLGTFR